MSLNLNQELQNKYPHLEISVLNLSDAMKDNEKLRIDAEFFQSKFTKLDNLLSKKNCKNLQSITKSIRKGIFDISPSHYLEKGIPFLRVQNIQNSFLDTSNCVFISEEYSKNEFKTELHYGDLALSKVGSVGRFCFITETVNTSQNVTSIKVNQQEINSHYLFIFLISKYGQMQFERQQSQQVQSKLELDDIRKTTIPLFPLSFQQQIEQMVKESHLCLEQSKALYREAEVLLYRELGLDPENPLATICPLSGSLKTVTRHSDSYRHSECSDSETKNLATNNNTPKYAHLNISVRTLKESFLATGRLDSEYYQTKYDEIEKVIKNYRGGYLKLKDIVINRSGGYAFSSDSYLEKGNLALIRINNIKNANLDLQNVVYLEDNAEYLSPKDKICKNDILISMSGSIGLCCVVRENINAMLNQRILKISVSYFDENVLCLLINSILCRLQLQRIGTGGVQTNISGDDILNILIPKIAIETQTQIAEKIKQSFTLRKKASELLQQAKSKVEIAIEQPSF